MQQLLRDASRYTVGETSVCSPAEFWCDRVTSWLQHLMSHLPLSVLEMFPEDILHAATGSNYTHRSRVDCCTPTCISSITTPRSRGMSLCSGLSRLLVTPLWSHRASRALNSAGTCLGCYPPIPAVCCLSVGSA